MLQRQDPFPAIASAGEVFMQGFEACGETIRRVDVGHGQISSLRGLDGRSLESLLGCILASFGDHGICQTNLNILCPDTGSNMKLCFPEEAC